MRSTTKFNIWQFHPNNIGAYTKETKLTTFVLNLTQQRLYIYTQKLFKKIILKNIEPIADA